MTENKLILNVEGNKEELLRYRNNLNLVLDERIKRIKKSFSWILSEENEASNIIFTTWSDWRMENKSFDWVVSNMELVFAWQSNEEMKRLKEYVESRVSFIIDNYEFKNTSWNSSLVLYNNNPNLVFPTRIWDSINLWWDNRILLAMKELVSQEIINDRNLYERFKDRFRYNKNIVKTWKNIFRWEEKKQFDFEEWLIFYNPENFVEWVKLWPLRAVQYVFALSLMRKIRNSWYHLDFIDELPSSIPDRLDFLFSNWYTKFSFDEIEDIKYIYIFFLKIYHQIQYEYLHSNKSEFLLDKDILKDIQKMLYFLSENLFADKFIK